MAGQDAPSITIRFNNVPLKEAILQLEEQTESSFFFEEAWLNNHFVTKSFDQQALKTILDGILQNTNINYFIKGDRIILLNNSIVYPELPADYFGEEELQELTNQEESVDETRNTTTPIFQEQFVSPTAVQKRRIVTIGKQDSNSQRKIFSLSGRVIDLITQLPIQNLSISVTGGSTFAITDANGYYSIELPSGLNKLETNLLGFQKILQDVIVYGDGSLNLEIAESVETLEEVIVESNRDANVREAVVGATIINVESIKTIPLVLGERDLLKVATTLPGIKTAGEGSSGLNVREIGRAHV